MTSIESITKHVCAELGVQYEIVFTKNRSQTVADARHIAITLAWESGLCKRSIAHFFKRDRTLVIHAIHKVSAIRETEPRLAQRIAQLKLAVSTGGA